MCNLQELQRPEARASFWPVMAGIYYRLLSYWAQRVNTPRGVSHALTHVQIRALQELGRIRHIAASVDLFFCSLMMPHRLAGPHDLGVASPCTRLPGHHHCQSDRSWMALGVIARVVGLQTVDNTMIKLSGLHLKHLGGARV
jgi:hypothetical protein